MTCMTDGDALFPVEVQLKYWGPDLLHPSRSLSLPCTVSGFSLTICGINWVLEPLWKSAVDPAVWSGESTAYNSDLRSWICISRDTSKSQLFLKLNNLQTEDTATYHCARVTVRGLQFESKQIIPLHGKCYVKQHNKCWKVKHCLFLSYVSPALCIIGSWLCVVALWTRMRT